MNRLFTAGEISVRDAFEVVDEEGEGSIEPINGVVDREGNPYLDLVKKILSHSAQVMQGVVEAISPLDEQNLRIRLAAQYVQTVCLLIGS